MSRIRAIEAKAPKVHKEVLQNLQADRNALNDSSKKKEGPLLYKDEVEKQQIKELVHKLPKLDKIFEVHRKIGEGTFSSVYLGSLRQHSNLPDTEKRWFAIKHLVPTAHPARIEHELRCLQDMGGKNNVIGVDLCLRHFDTIVFIMPYIPHRKFSEYVGEMDAAELRRYMRALLTALRHVHSFGVIHRDVKPSNFLYDRQNGRYLLVDFGLAQRVCAPPAAPPPAHASSACKRPREEDDAAPGAKRMALDLSVRARATPVPVTPKSVPASGAAGGGACACAGAGGVCAACARRGAARAPRAGTQGFRPPEVLLKYPHQTTAVDLWAAGVVLASVLTARYPFFRAADDMSALAELADFIGTDALQRTAKALGRRVVSSSWRRGLCLRKLAMRRRGVAPPAAAPPCARCNLPAEQCLCPDDSISAGGWSGAGAACGFPGAAFALAARLLEPQPARRATAAEALRHPFFAAPDLPPHAADAL
ncbi:cell division cycle 7-related protein kinase-like [Epargyreus clarus]|uniref:cell division cycle 7-related protein kinase-like n=1 Tax=Epargyreus clarus TaxID=520877 RepID=UPI003C2FE7F1